MHDLGVCVPIFCRCFETVTPNMREVIALSKSCSSNCMVVADHRRSKITDPLVWHCADMEDDDSWVHKLPDHVYDCGLDYDDIKAKFRGIKGSVVDGLVQDSPDIVDLEFPMFARGVTPVGHCTEGLAGPIFQCAAVAL